MKKDPEILDDDLYLDDLDIENLLKPRCDFHVSPGFRQRVMEEAKAMPPYRRLRRIPFIAASAAAAVAALVILTVMHYHDHDDPIENPVANATMESPTKIPHDTLYKYKEIPIQLIVEASQPKQDTPNIRKSISIKRPKSKKATSAESFSMEEPKAPKPQPVTEGEMPMISRDKSLDPDEVRTRLLETRRNAEIAYIERMRDEIEATDAYISQFVTYENIINPNTQIGNSF